MGSIPIIAASRITQFAEILDEAGAPVDRYLEASGIPVGIREEPVGFVPGRLTWRFLESCIDREGIRDLCLHAARRVGWSGAGAWALPVLHAPTLRDAIRAMCRSYVQEVAMVELGLTVRGPIAWFWRRHTANVQGWEGQAHAEQYMLSHMLELVRLAAGRTWVPPQLQLMSPATWADAFGPALPGTRIEFGGPRLALGIPRPLLSLPIEGELWKEASRSETAFEPAASSTADRLRQMLRPFITASAPNEEVQCELLGISPRTLRRQLAAESTSWREILDDLRYERAVSLLAAAKPSIREISEALGYSDPAHFTRFFSRKADLTPSAYRREVERARAALS